MKVDCVYINTHRYDWTITRICIASIRYWYPEIPIRLIIDHSNGEFHWGGLTSKWNVDVLDTGAKKYGWGFGKFEPLFRKGEEGFLVLDADTVMAGPVLDVIEKSNADFVVDDEQQDAVNFSRLYYVPDLVKKHFPDFIPPGYSFNTGQWVGKTGIISISDFNELVSWEPSPVIRYPDSFKQADQGLFNFLLQRLEQKGTVRIDRKKLMLWPAAGAGDFIQVDAIAARKDKYPFVIHWAGIKFKRDASFPLLPLVQFYENYYYQRYPFFVRWTDRCREWAYGIEKKIRTRVKKFL